MTKKLLAIIIATSLFSGSAESKTVAEIFSDKSLSPEKIGYEIAKEADLRDIGFVDSMADMEMVLKNEHGQSVIRQMQNKTLENTKKGLGDKSVSLFFTPDDVRGTAVLTHSKVLEADDQWLYLPALKRVKRISSQNKSGPFLGSEFSYEDISSNEVDKYSYKFLRVEKCPEAYPNIDCLVSESYPLYEHSGYTKRVAWIDAQEFRVIKVEFYDRKSSLLKILNYKNYEKFLGKFWRAKLMEINNVQTKKSTSLIFKNYKFKNGFSGADFDESSLRKN
jgi:hypothetical protein